MSSHPSRADSGQAPREEAIRTIGHQGHLRQKVSRNQGISKEDGWADPVQATEQSKKLEEAVRSELLKNPGPEGLGAHGEEGPAAHPIPAPGGQAASIGAEATAAYGALVSPELSATGKVFCLLWQCQQLPWPQTHCEVLCIRNGERGRFSERGSDTGLGGQRQRESWGLKVMSEGTAPREGCRESHPGPGQGSFTM